MAKGNIGNLMQHFVALRAMQKVVDLWAKPDVPIEYIDCYSMAPWEEIDGKQPQGFVGLVRRFRNKRRDNELVSSVFLKAWEARYRGTRVPTHPQDRDYPNTAVLIRTAFPKQSWRMRLHEDDSTKNGKRKDLAEWASLQTEGEYLVDGDWTKSKLIGQSPAPVDRPVIVMLDPFKIIPDDHDNAGKGGYLTAGLLLELIGNGALSVSGRPQMHSAEPLVMTVFSYGDTAPDVPDGVVRGHFSGTGWSVEGVRIGPWRGQAGMIYHQGWIVSTGISSPVLGSSLQSEWDDWVQ